MSQQVPYDNGGYSQGGYPPGNDIMASGYADAGGYGPQGYGQGYVPQNAPPQYDGGHPHQPHAPKMYARNRAPMIDPIESAKLTPQILVLLVLSGLRRHWKWSLPTGLILGLITAGILYLVFPLQYEAVGTIQIRSTRQAFIFESGSVGRYDDFVNTQLAIIKSPAVLDKALEDTAVSKLPIVAKQRDRRGWLRRQLHVRPEGKSEIVAIRIEADTKEAAEKIVKAVMDCYFDFIQSVAKKTENDLLAGLTQERRRQDQNARQLQEQIRASTRSAAQTGAVAGEAGMVAGMGQGESLFREWKIAETQLVAMKVKRKSIEERLKNPNIIPPNILVQMNPELREMNAQRTFLLQQKEGLPPNNPRAQIIQSQIDAIDAKMGSLTGNGDNPQMQELQKQLRLEVEFEAFNIDQDIITQEFMVEEYKKQYEEQLKYSTDRSDNVVDASFFHAQLNRTNKLLEHIEERLLAVSSEQRAPGQITPLSEPTGSLPSILKQAMVVGMGAAMVAVFPMLLSIAIERIKPRLYHVSQVRRAIPQVLIGEIMEPPVAWVHGAAFRKRLAQYRESVHNWCTHLLLSDPFRSCQTLSIASVAGDDGKTFLAIQIAVAMAQMKEGKVLLIDGDMRVGRLHLLFGNEEAGVGLANVLDFRVKPAEAIMNDENEPNLYLMSAGQLDVSPYELLGDGRFSEMLDSQKLSAYNPGGYSLIIVVVPPVANAAESLIMAASTDTTLLCVRQGETVLAAMEDVYRKLVNTGASVDGIVVKDIPYYQVAGRDGGFADKLEQIRLSHLLQYSE